MAKGFERNWWGFETFEIDEEMLRVFTDNGEMQKSAIARFLIFWKRCKKEVTKGLGLSSTWTWEGPFLLATYFAIKGLVDTRTRPATCCSLIILCTVSRKISLIQDMMAFWHVLLQSERRPTYSILVAHSCDLSSFARGSKLPNFQKILSFSQ